MGELPREYWETRYEVELACGRVVAVRIGQETPNEVAGPWAIITAWNPGSRQVTAEENEVTQRRLVAALKSFATKPAIGKADRGDWEEESLFVQGIGKQEAVRVGRQFGQWAVVWCDKGGRAEIVDCR